MSREQASISELLLSLDSSELQEAERVRAAVNQQLSTGEFNCAAQRNDAGLHLCDALTT